MTTEAEYFDLLKRAERDPSVHDLVDTLIMSAETMAPGHPFRAAMAAYMRKFWRLNNKEEKR